MAKTVIKEMIIMLLLCLAILLLLGILLYEYVPMTKTVPNPVSYTTPDNVKQELADTADIDESQVIMTYEVDATDLNNYKSIQNYKPGKANPFSSYDTTGTSGTNTTTTTSSTGVSQIGQNTTPSQNTTNGSVVTNPTTNSQTTTTDNAQSVGTQQNQSNDVKEDTSTTSGGHFFQDKGTK